MDMFYGASPVIFSKAKSLRNNTTQSESRIWLLIKDRYKNFKFRRQHPMGPYIADFYCHKLKLVIELDGKHHFEDTNQIAHDKQRDDDMMKWGVKVLRYSNETNPQNILKDIEDIINQYQPAPCP
jgi:very-short-patch-repair endonuclease